MMINVIVVSGIVAFLILYLVAFNIIWLVEYYLEHRVPKMG